jgi:hypothetical protein
LKVLASPGHSEYKDIVAWLGAKYKAEKFDFAAVKFANPKTQWKRWQEI